MFDELLANKTPGTTAVMSDSGWSNSIIFKDYLENHFMKYAQKPQESSQRMLILYDGHKSHVCKPVIDWARENCIVLFTLPPHCSHILQPLDIGCFSPLKSKFNRECQIFLRSNPCRQITRYDICCLACKAYEKGLSPSNLVAAFRRAGIVPFDRSKISPQQLAPSTILVEHDDTELQSLSVEDNKENNRPVSEENNIETLQLPDVEPEISTQQETPKYIAEPIQKTAKSLLDSKIPVKQKTEPKKSRKRSIHYGGVEITSANFYEQVQKADIASEVEIKPSKSKQKQSAKKRKPEKKPSKPSKKTDSQQVAGPSAIYISATSSEDEEEDVGNDEPPCCVCKKRQPPTLNLMYTLEM